jgi:drug/metabolite transporter (DMT)-like permease
MLSNRQKGVLLIITSAAGFAFFPTITRSLYRISELQPTDIGVWRFVFACAILWLIQFIRTPHESKRPPIPLRHLLVLGVLYAFSALSAFIGLQRINGSLYVVLFYTYPAMVVLISLALGKPLSRYAWFALGLTLIGILFTIPDFRLLQGGNLEGVLLALANALFVAIYMLASSRFMSGVGNMVNATVWMMSATLLVILVAIPFFGLRLPTNLETLGVLLLLAVISTVIPIFCLNAGIQYVGAAQASILSSVEPALAIIIAVIILQEVVLPLQILGAALIICAVIVLELSPKKAKV